MSSTALPPLADEHAVPPSPSRVVISLAPLPSNDPSTDAAPPTAAPTMLQDYLQRLSRFEPRMRRYTVSKLSEVDEPVGAFSGGSSVMSSPPPGVIGAPEVAQDKGLLAGYSLGDLEQLLLNAAPSWWKGKSAEGEGSSSRDDEQGLDVDLSEIFGHTTISSPQLGHDDDEEEEEEGDGTGPGLFLNYYSADSLITLFKSTGILSALAAKGFNHPSLIFDTSDSFQHRLSLVDSSLFKANGGAQLGSNDRYLLDLYMKRRETWGLDAMVSYQLMKRLVKAGGWEELREVTGEVRSPYVGVEGAEEVVAFFETMIPKFSLLGKKGDGSWDVTEIAWMQMHDPTAETTRPLLPGQRFPGLGLGREVASLMESMATESHVTDALLNFPFHYHNSTVYAFRGYKHIDPIYEAYHQWLTQQLLPTITLHGFCFVAWAISHGHLRRHTSILSPSGRVVVSNRLERWCPSEQVFATGESMKAYLDSREYRELYEKYKKRFNEDGGAGMKGVRVEGEEGEGRRAELVIDLEGCPELWKYSKIWSRRDPETGEFPDPDEGSVGAP